MQMHRPPSPSSTTDIKSDRPEFGSCDCRPNNHDVDQSTIDITIFIAHLPVPVSRFGIGKLLISDSSQKALVMSQRRLARRILST
ncbi:hypothetical protein BJY01DRAFT_166210 [Aspergillus pseudoustus]|uniref:Uncharacterized protein n=1 Tax=Aspergillus pseudoustus TaxID=1810923 RepID=A0ABR4K581_9EURO